MGVAGADVLLSLIKQKQDLQGYRERHWTGTLASPRTFGTVTSNRQEPTAPGSRNPRASATVFPNRIW